MTKISLKQLELLILLQPFYNYRTLQFQLKLQAIKFDRTVQWVPNNDKTLHFTLEICSLDILASALFTTSSDFCWERFVPPAVHCALSKRFMSGNKFIIIINDWAHQTRWHFLVQSKNWKHQSNAWNLFKNINKEMRTMSITSFRCFYFSLWTYFTHCCNVSIVSFEQIIAVVVC